MPAAPQTLMMMVKDDAIVPNDANALYARGLGLPHVGDIIVPIGIIPEQATLPIQNNLAAGITGGMFQYDLVWKDGGPETEAASHMNISRNPVALAQAIHFLTTFETQGSSELIDPYKVLGIK
jgi:hypothetical protein